MTRAITAGLTQIKRIVLVVTVSFNVQDLGGRVAYHLRVVESFMCVQILHVKKLAVI